MLPADKTGVGFFFFCKQMLSAAALVPRLFLPPSGRLNGRPEHQPQNVSRCVIFARIFVLVPFVSH